MFHVQMLSLFILVALFLSAECGEFNMFKSYKDAPIKPHQYGKGRKRFPTSEYLSPIQKKMMKYRKGADVPGAMFTDQWSGFDAKANSNPVVTRRLESSSSSIETIFDYRSYFEFGAVLLGGGMLYGVYKVVMSWKKDNKTNDDNN